MDATSEPGRIRLIENLIATMLTLLPEEGSRSLEAVGITASRRDAESPGSPCLAAPMLLLVIQGEKMISHGCQNLCVQQGECSALFVDTPIVSCSVSPTSEPLLSVSIELRKPVIAELLVEMPGLGRAAPDAGLQPSRWLADDDFLETVLRLLRVWLKESQTRYLAPLLLREILFLALAGEHGASIRAMYVQEGRDSRIMEAIAWLKHNLAVSLPVSELAARVDMSVSSLHRQFKNITGYSPLQYQKQLRLYEAQRLMLVENERADIAAFAVGYESITQFNREYNRMFGQPPRRDVQMRRQALRDSSPASKDSIDNGGK